MAQQTQDFDAFISYSHAADGRLAPAVQSGLQRLARKVFQRRALRVFRDETGLSTNPHLWGSIETALDTSAWFVLLASPESARSEWVNREVSTWLERKPLDHLLVVVTDGEIAFAPDGPVDATATTCLPAPLMAALESEPRWLDLRWARQDTQLDLRNGRFRAAIADLAAPIHGVAKDDLESEDVRQQKKARRLAGAGIVAVSILAIVSLVAALVAFDQRREADAQRTEAEAQRAVALEQEQLASEQRDEAEAQRDRADVEANRAVAKSLAAQATALAPTDIDLSLLLAAEGYRRDASLDTEAGLLEALNRAQLFTSLDTPLPGGIADIDKSPNGDLLYVLTFDGLLTAHDAETLEQVGAPLAEGIPEPWGVLVSADGSRVSYGGGDGAAVIDVETGDTLVSGLGSGTSLAKLDRFGGRALVFAAGATEIPIVDVDTGAVTHVLPSGGEADGIFITGTRVATQELGSTLMTVYDLGPDGSVELVKELETVPGGGMMLSPDGSMLVTGGLAGTAVLVDTATLETTGPVLQVRGSRTGDFAFSPDGFFLVLSSDEGSATVVDMFGTRVNEITGLTGTLVSEFVAPNRVVSVALGSNDSAVWTVTDGAPIGTADSKGEGGIVGLHAIDDGERLVIGYEEAVEVVMAEQPREAQIRRDLPGLVRTVDANGRAGMVAAYRLVIDEAGESVTEREVHVMSLDTLEDLLVLTFGEDPIEAVRLSPDGALIAIGYRDGRLSVVETSTGDAVLPPVLVDEYPCCVGTLVWSPDGSRLHVGGQDGTLRTFDTATWEIVGTHLLAAGQFALRTGQLSDDGTTIVLAAESGEVFLLDSETGEPIGRPFIAAGTQLQTAVLVNGGSRLVAESRDGAMRIWDVATGRTVGPPLQGHFEYVLAMAKIDGDTVMSGGGIDQRLVTWELDPATWVEKACALAGRNLTQSEWDVYVGGEYEVTCEQWPAGT